MIQIKRVYEAPEKSDGVRLLIDRLWPRGIKKSELSLDEWIKELAPSSEIRKKFGHDPDNWKEFKSEYLKELRSPEAKEKLEEITKLARKMNLTLLYSARNEEYNNARVLKEVLERKLKKH